MKFLKRFILIILVLVLILIGVGYLLPDEVHVERELRIDAPPETVFPYVNNLRKFNEWSPWAEKAPDSQYSYSGPDSGVGATMDWQSDSPEIGNGNILITESKSPSRVTMRLDLGAQGRPTVYFNIEPANTGSHVVWGFDTTFGNNIIERYFGLILNFRVGGEYEQGLQNLKTLAEKNQDD